MELIGKNSENSTNKAANIKLPTIGYQGLTSIMDFNFKTALAGIYVKAWSTLVTAGQD